jgi:hypothetical protein
MLSTILLNVKLTGCGANAVNTRLLTPDAGGVR